jgi:hypothetical protein
VLNTPIVTRGKQIMPRSTMPARGLRDTAPFHWDGIPGDPYGGNNSANVYRKVAPNSSVDIPESSTRHLVDGALANTMSTVGQAGKNDEGKAGGLTAAERDDMAKFLLGVPYPPAQRRAYTNVVSSRAKKGFELFHIKGDLEGKPKPNVCGSCHRMPFLVSTNTPGTGMDAPTWRGAYDRWLILPQGRLNIIDFGFYRRIAERGAPERKIWQLSWANRRRFDPVWDMVLEGSTGVSGSFARQVTLNEASARRRSTDDLLDALELSAGEGALVLQGEGVFLEKGKARPVSLEFDARVRGGTYVDRNDATRSYTRESLAMFASVGHFVGTFTGRHGANAGFEHPQPALWTLGPIEKQRGRQKFPIVHQGNHRMKLSGRHIQKNAHVIVNGRRVSGTVSCADDETVTIELATLPSVGMHLLQVQNPGGLFSNDFIFHVAKDAKGATDLQRQIDLAHVDSRDLLTRAISTGDLAEVKKLVRSGVSVNPRRSSRSRRSPPLNTAVLQGYLDIAKYLIRRRADVSAASRDGTTALHIAALLCDFESVELLLKSRASTSKKNRRGQTPIDVVSSRWSRRLERTYESIAKDARFEIDLEKMKRDRPRMVKVLRGDGAAKSKETGTRKR